MESKCQEKEVNVSKMYWTSCFRSLLNINASPPHFLMLEVAFQIAMPVARSEKVKPTLSQCILIQTAEKRPIPLAVAPLPWAQQLPLAWLRPSLVHVPLCAGERARPWQPSEPCTRCQLGVCSKGGESSSAGNAYLDCYFSLCVFVYIRMGIYIYMGGTISLCKMQFKSYLALLLFLITQLFGDRIPPPPHYPLRAAGSLMAVRFLSLPLCISGPNGLHHQGREQEARP